MKQLFHIERGNTENVQQVLSLQLGEKHASFAVTNKTGHELYELAFCVADEWNENSLSDLLTAYPILDSSFQQVQIAYDSPQSILIPSEIHQPQEAQVLLGTSHGILSGYHIINELIAEWQLYNTYAVPAEIHKWVHQKFPGATSRHLYSLGVKKIHAAGTAGILLVDFKTNDFNLLVAKDSKLLLAQSLPYTTPADVVYYLLKSCRQFSLSQQQVYIRLSGLVELHSALYNELFSYFIHVECSGAGWNSGGEFPDHFFTSLYNLAQCAL